MAQTPNVIDGAYKPLVDKNTNGRQRLLRMGQRASLGSIGWAYNDDDAVPYDQVLALIAGAGGGDMLAAVYDPTGQATDIFDINNILIGNNVSQTMLVFDNGGGQQSQLSSAQILVGSNVGTVSMDATGLLYCDDGASFRSELDFNSLTIMIAGIPRASLVLGTLNLSDGGLNLVTLDASVPQLRLSDGSNIINIDNLSISDGGGGGGINFSATVGDIVFPAGKISGIGWQTDLMFGFTGSGISLQGSATASEGSILIQPNNDIEALVKSASRFNLSDGTGTAKYAIEGTSGFSGSGVFTNFTIQGGIITNAS